MLQNSIFPDSDRNLVMTPEEEELKAKEMVDYYKICFAHPAVEGILMWGFWEGDNWIRPSSLYKRDWTPTPAAIAYQNQRTLFNQIGRKSCCEFIKTGGIKYELKRTI